MARHRGDGIVVVNPAPNGVFGWNALDIKTAESLRDQLDKAIEEARIGSDPPFERWWRSLLSYGGASKTTRFIQGPVSDVAINRNQAETVWNAAWNAAKEAK